MIKFKNPPVIEVVSAVQWQPSLKPFSLPDATLNKLLSDFTNKVAELDFCQSERLIPAGVPIMPLQPVIKYSKIKGKTYFYQLGDGIFSAHAIQPYESWQEFKPVVKSGLELLISLMPKEYNPFESASLRYIDAFKKDMLGNIKPYEFISIILKVEPPKYLKDKSSVNLPSIQDIVIATQLKNNMNLLTIAREVIDSNSKEHMIILDNTVTANGKLDVATNIIDSMNEAHGIISDIFIEITKPIHENLGAYDV